MSFSNKSKLTIIQRRLLNACVLLQMLTISGSIYADENKKVVPTAFATCSACHGTNGEGNVALNAPVIAGQSESYLSRQLVHFKKGMRGKHSQDKFGAQMLASVQPLTVADDIPKLAAYIASLPVPKLENQTAGDLKNGSRYYQAKCGACHGGQAQGNESFKAPRLSGQSHQYLLRQMQYFTDGVRGTSPEDKPGRQMAMMAKTVNDAELNDILYFISLQ